MKIIEKVFSWRGIDSSHRLMMVIVAALGLFNLFFGEKVPVNDGFGWDGVLYGNMVRDLERMISEGRLSLYYSQRILPSAIVRGLMLVTGASFSPENIIKWFELYNLSLLLATCWLWKKVADQLRLSLASRWIGFCALFLNFMSSKQVFYYPVLTDTTAFFVGMLLLYFYIGKRPFAILITTVLGALAWQVVGVCGAMLLLFLKYDLPAESVEPQPSHSPFAGHTVVRAVMWGWAVLLLLSVLVFTLLVGWQSLQYDHFRPRLVASADKFITGLPSLAVVVIALAMLAGSAGFFRAMFSKSWMHRWPLILLALAALLLPRAIVQVISNPLVTNVSGAGTVSSIALFPPGGKFLLPFVTHVAYWGPVVILLVLKWKAFCIEARKLGPGFMAVIAISLPLGLCTEPRFITISWPFFVIGAVLVMENSMVRVSFKYVYAVLTLLFSQFWLPINSVPWRLDFYGGYNQLYFMHHGLFMVMGALPYALYVALVLVSLLWLRSSMTTVKATGEALPVQ